VDDVNSRLDKLAQSLENLEKNFLKLMLNQNNRNSNIDLIESSISKSFPSLNKIEEEK